MSSSFKSPKPKLACEISADRVLAGRLPPTAARSKLARRANWRRAAWYPIWSENNLRRRGAVRAGIEEALGGVAGRSRDVIAILPDAAVRVVLLDFETLPSEAG